MAFTNRPTLRAWLERLKRWLRFQWMYLGQPPWNTGQTPPEVWAYLRTHPPGRALDLGCGNGTNLLALARAGWQVTGVDFSPRPVFEARRRLARSGFAADVRLGDVTRLETIAGQYDLVLDIGCYHGIPAAGRAAYLANLVQVLAPGGRFLLYAHWNDAPAHSVGINEHDVLAFSRWLRLETRQDSEDRFGRRALWMEWQKGEAADA